MPPTDRVLVYCYRLPSGEYFRRYSDGLATTTDERPTEQELSDSAEAAAVVELLNRRPDGQRNRSETNLAHTGDDDNGSGKEKQ